MFKMTNLEMDYLFNNILLKKMRSKFNEHTIYRTSFREQMILLFPSSNSLVIFTRTYTKQIIYFKKYSF